MPSQINVQLTGRIQNIVFYKRGDKYYARTLPQKVKQTKGTKKRATEFGKASTMGKCFRQQMLPVIPFPSDIKMQTRLVSTLFQWLRSGYDPLGPCDPVPFVSNFQFTEGYSVRDRWRVDLQVTNPATNMLQLTIPAFVPESRMSAPAGTIRVKCHIAAAGCHVENRQATGGFLTSLDFDYNDTQIPEQIISLPLSTVVGTLVLTAISLEFLFIKNGHLQKTANKAFMPAGVVSAMYF